MNVFGAMAYGGYAEATTARQSTAKDDVLGKDDFLKLLVTQLTYQDPLDPVSDQEFIAQLAQFSALEQMQNVSKGIDDLIEVQLGLGAMSQAAALIGRTVVVMDYETGEPVEVEGVVEAVRVVGGVPMIFVDGLDYSIWDVVEVRS